jgi:hypothetical protein
MLSRIITLCLFVRFFAPLQAQTPCIPNDTSTAIVFPGPEINGVGGIAQIACVGKPYNFTWTFNIPPQTTISGFTIQLDSVSAATTGAVKNLPANLGYSCNPPNCVFKANVKGCIGIAGTVAASNPVPSDLDLLIAVKVHGKAFGGIPVTQDLNVPDPAITGAGKYTMRVRAANDPLCTVGAYEQQSAVTGISLSPVPAVDQLTISLDVLETGAYQMWVLDATGRQLESRVLDLTQGENQTSIDASQYAAGMYRLVFVKDGLFASETFVVNK